MADYLISKAAVQKMLIELREHLNEHYISIGISMALQKMEGFKPADAVEVVRCRDCRNSQKLKTCADQVYCSVWKSNPRTDGYCYLGAKMDGGEPHEENPHTL